MAEDYNKIDIENDSVVVISAKLAALTKALRARAEKAVGKEKAYLKTILSKPLIQLDKEQPEGEAIEPVEPIPEEEILGNPGSVLSKPLAEWP